MSVSTSGNRVQQPLPITRPLPRHYGLWWRAWNCLPGRVAQFLAGRISRGLNAFCCHEYEQGCLSVVKSFIKRTYIFPRPRLVVWFAFHLRRWDWCHLHSYAIVMGQDWLVLSRLLRLSRRILRRSVPISSGVTERLTNDDCLAVSKILRNKPKTAI